MLKFFHRLFNPHCPHCLEEDRIKHERQLEETCCPNCEILKGLLEASNFEKSKLIDALIPRPTAPAVNHEDIQPIRPRIIPWHVRQQMLQKEDRAKAIALKNAAKPDETVAEPAKETKETVLPGATTDKPATVEQLEQELGVVHAAEN